MNINLTRQLETYIQQKVASGYYNNASEVIREALRLLIEREQAREQEHAAKIAGLRPAIQEELDNLVEPWERAEEITHTAKVEATTMVIFDGRPGYGDVEYLQWCDDNRNNGFVLNALKQLSGLQGKLHKAYCGTITSAKRTNWTTTTYDKICSLDRQELINWAHQHKRDSSSCQCMRRNG